MAELAPSIGHRLLSVISQAQGFVTATPQRPGVSLWTRKAREPIIRRMQPRRFTVEEATKLLGWLESKFAELDPYRQELLRHKKQSAQLLGNSRSNGSSHAGEELHRVQQLVEELEKSVQDIIDQIASRGIMIQNLDRGLVDFPSTRDGRAVFLCWLRGESHIGYWHDMDAGFAGRRPL